MGKSGQTIDFAGFDLDDPDLPAAVEDQAMTSGRYPYDKRMGRKKYEKELRLLQIELLKLQYWVRDADERIVILFEGRDAAGKGGTIKRFMQHLNPRHARAVALSKPTEAECGQWFFQRYIPHLPTAGDIVLFDRSWYNRAGVERVMGFCTEQQVGKFFEEAPDFEAMLVRDGIRLFKFWLTIGRPMQIRRFHRRRHDPLKQWKLSEIDLAAIPKWDAYTEAKEDLFRHTHTDAAPWTVVRANDKRRTRLNAIRHVLSAIDYANKDPDVVSKPDPKLVGSGDAFFFDA
jgi:polyphosphate kinase 2